MLITDPPPRALIGVIDSCSRIKGARRFTAMIASQRATAMCSRSPRPVSAALLTRMSRPPNRSTAKRISARQTSSFARSPSKYSASPPAALTRRTVSKPSERSRPCTTAFDPSPAKCSATPRPIPELDPVTTETLPASVLTESAPGTRGDRGSSVRLLADSLDAVPASYPVSQIHDRENHHQRGRQYCPNRQHAARAVAIVDPPHDRSGDRCGKRTGRSNDRQKQRAAAREPLRRDAQHGRPPERDAGGEQRRRGERGRRRAGQAEEEQADRGGGRGGCDERH